MGVRGIEMLLTDEEIAQAIDVASASEEWREGRELEDVIDWEDRVIAKAQLSKDADAIDSMVADGWYLGDIVKAMRKELE